jgi:hypothetical protein
MVMRSPEKALAQRYHPKSNRRTPLSWKTS